MTQLVDRTVLVTGANRGMGREFVRQFLDRGVAKVYAAARDPQTVVVDDPRVVPLQLDVTDAGSVARAAEVAQDVSVVVNNAGIARGWPRSPPGSPRPGLAPTGCRRRLCGAPPTPCAWNSGPGACRSSESTSGTSTPT